MHSPNYNHPPAPARAIPLGEEPLVTKAKVCAQLRAAIQILEEVPWNIPTLTAAGDQVKAASRVIFVAREELRTRTIRVKVQVGLMAREKRS